LFTLYNPCNAAELAFQFSRFTQFNSHTVCYKTKLYSNSHATQSNEATYCMRCTSVLRLNSVKQNIIGTYTWHNGQHKILQQHIQSKQHKVVLIMWPVGLHKINFIPAITKIKPNSDYCAL